MDRSFLLQKDVIDASREFVCIRLATYEDPEEVKYLTQIFRGSGGTLENTVYTMLSPDARKYLTRSGRSPDFAFSGAADMANQMRAFSKQYSATGHPAALPAMKDLRLSLDVAACDNMPLVVAISDDAEQRKALNAKLAEAAWSKPILGQYAFAPASTSGHAAAIKLAVKPGIYALEPNAFGTTAKVLIRLEPGATADAITEALTGALAKFNPPVKEARSHIDSGVQSGIYWKTATPVTDPHGPRRPEPRP